MNSITFNIDAVNINAISEIQQCLDLYDITSLVFLLYDIPHMALEHLASLQRIPKEDRKDINTLCDWVRWSQNRNTWKYEFLEALAICQLFGVIKKMGFDVSLIQKHFLPNNVHIAIYINPMKKLLYKICENVQLENLINLKEMFLFTYNIDVYEYEMCELIFLKLIVNKFITIGSWETEHKMRAQCNMKKLADILRNLRGLTNIALELHQVENYINNHIKPLDVSVNIKERQKSDLNDPDYQDFTQIDEIFKKISLTEELTISPPKLKADSSNLNQESYPVIKQNRLGICYIINQEQFYPSRESIAKNIKTPDNRKGTEIDEIKLEQTMKLYNIKVLVDRNLTHRQIPQKIKNIIKNKVSEGDSIFISCILSHGCEGGIFGADSVPVQMKSIHEILDSDAASKLHSKPKVLIIQACQNSQEPETKFMIVGPENLSQNLTYTPKSDFLIYWSTSSELLAYRDENQGSIFIQILCSKLKKHGKEEPLHDIFAKVNEDVICMSKNYNGIQVPSLISTLRKKLYLQ